MWKSYMNDFDVYGEVISRYKIGMENNILSRYTNCDVILIDESHNFRNSNTNSYKALLAFMEEKTDEAKIIMLTATPISNGITDLKNQLQLFPKDALLQIPPLANTSLEEYFKIPREEQNSQETYDKIKELLKYILIRRTRSQIKEKYAKQDDRGYYLEKDGEKKYFPDRKLENPKEYDPDIVYNDSFDSIQKSIKELKLARYAPGNYIKDEYRDETHPHYRKYADLSNTTKPLVGIVRTSLLKRMESSVMAFASSVDNYEHGNRKFKDQLDQNRVPIGKDFHDEIYKKITYDDDSYDDDEYEKKMSEIKSEYDIDAFDLKAWKEDIILDIQIFSKIKTYLYNKKDYTKYDDKLHTLEKLIKDTNAEKILIFSESAVTTKYIYEYMREKLPQRKIAQIDSKQGQKEKNELIKSFDPKNNNADISKNKEIDILISTDVLSEGVNLQACGIVINYDFHWNPVRLIQRVGRIDRIGTEHDKIRVINFLPTTKIEAALSLKERVTNKIKTIQGIIGTDQSILEATEKLTINKVSDIYTGNEDVLDSDIVGILDLQETKSEKDADIIKKDKVKLGRIQNLPFGIRGISGNGKLLIACEAQELIINHNGDKISERDFRRYYEITSEGVRRILPSSFLKQLGDNIDDVVRNTDSTYNEFVAKARYSFNREMKNSMGKKTLLKHQTYFEKKLKKIAEKSDMQHRIMPLLAFVIQRMLANHQPYKKLNILRKTIDSDSSINDEMIVTHLEEIKQKYEETVYIKKINKPKILYSVMMNK